MCAWYFRRRWYPGRGRGRGNYLRFGPRYGWRRRYRRRYYSAGKWRVRRRRRFRGRRRRLFNRRRLKRLRIRRRFLGPVAVKQYWPPVRTKCYIRGFFPLLYFTEAQMYSPFLDPTTDTYYGGGISFQDMTFEWLFREYMLGHNKWSRSNFGFDYARFRWAKIFLYRHDYVTYCCRYFQGPHIDDNENLWDIHPGELVLSRHKICVKSNHECTIRKKHTRKKFKVYPPTNLTTEWYPMCDLSEKILLRLGCSVANYREPFQQSLDRSGNYYVTVGYNTPDRRTLEHYKSTVAPGAVYEVINDINAWGKHWSTWGGPINTAIPYQGVSWWCSNRYPEMGTQGEAPYNAYPEFATCVKSEGAMYTNRHPVYLVDWYSPQAPHDKAQKKPMWHYCGQSTNPPGSTVITRTPDPPLFDSFTKLPGNGTFIPKKCSRSSHTCPRRLRKYELDTIPKEHVSNQGFWPGRYNWIYDNGKSNVVYGCYLTENQFNQGSTYKKMATMGYGPGTGATSNFSTIKVSQGVPYWKVFYGHNYQTFLRFLNKQYPEIVANSYNHMGFFAVAIRAFPAEFVGSGPFAGGYAPLRYYGSNCEYFTEENNQGQNAFKKWWSFGDNQPPLTPDGNINYDCWIFCLLRDGRQVMYGSSLEVSLLTTSNGGNYYTKASTYNTGDDIATLGKGGPFLLRTFPTEMKGGETVVNLCASYVFKFQFGGYVYPGKYRQPVDPKSYCNPKPRILEPGDEDDDRHTSRRARRSKRSLYGTDAYGTARDPVHPREASAVSFYPDRDLDRHGFITPDAMQRLMSSSLSTLTERPFRHGTKRDYALWSSFRPQSSEGTESSFSSSSSSDGESKTATDIRAHQRKAQKRQVRAQKQAAQETEEETETGICLPCTKKWQPPPVQKGKQYREFLRREQRIRERQQSIQLQQLSYISKVRKKRDDESESSTQMSS